MADTPALVLYLREYGTSHFYGQLSFTPPNMHIGSHYLLTTFTGSKYHTGHRTESLLLPWATPTLFQATHQFPLYTRLFFSPMSCFLSSKEPWSLAGLAMSPLARLTPLPEQS